MKKKYNLISFIILFFFVSSCTTHEDNKFLGQVIGSAVGAYVGSKFGSGTGKTISMILGSAAGFLIAGKLVNILNENDREDFSNKVQDTLEENADNTSRKWASKTEKGTNGEVTPLNSYELDGHSCRDFSKIIFRDGEKHTEQSTACRDMEGNWKLI